ncbi:N-acetylmuramoyl-L-alanine amidase family protein [Clostridium vincentii]|uniref:N-acetylmuramoyl-l-alanine amidase I n=1 Tax=Clostridium vincentii TaxID=52704 RepID=A0A2T0BDD1_9CLOT|nr:N-acetylmuramoyl-L-alanine amidase [Clostridium vincentii]PRR81842.1 N-acetylmuramoyl-l-alanine amidase I [Clostridium vincentii]
MKRAMKRTKSTKRRNIITLGIVAVICLIMIFYFKNPKVEDETFVVAQNDETTLTLTLAKTLGGASNSIDKTIVVIKEEVQTTQVETQTAQRDTVVKSETKAAKTGRVIVIDAGHSLNPAQGTEAQAPGSTIMKAKDVSGAFSTNAGYGEYLLNQQIADLLKVDLEKRGFTVIMTKSNINQSMGNIARAEVGNNANADLVIRIHADSFDNSSAKGASMLVPAANNQYTSAISQTSSKYGQTILNSYTSVNPLNNRGLVVSDTMTGFNWSKVPVVLLEMGFLSNSGDEAYLINANNHGKIVDGISQGIVNCFA